MKTLYLECAMGAAGDMLAAALLELLDDPAPYFNAMSQLRRHGVAVSAAPAVRCGITGTALTVTVHGAEEGAGHDHEAHDGCTHDHEMHHDHGAHGHDHHHAGLDGICHLISHLALPPQVSRDACAVFTLLAQAESHVHGCPVEQIHFHEVGTMDAVADIVGVCLLVHLLAPERIAASAVHVGSGTVRCAHGVLPVPAPATAYLLRDVPIYGGAVQGELYYQLARHENEMAIKLAKGVTDAGYQLWIPHQTNQVFVIMNNDKIAELEKEFFFYTWCPYDDHRSVIRLVTNWNTQESEVDALLRAL